MTDPDWERLNHDATVVLHATGPGPLRDRFLAQLAAHQDAMSRSGPPHHLTASTLVLSHDHTQVLLTLHTKAQQWFQLGGHIESTDATIADAALREATEESGIAGLTLLPTPVHLDEHAVPFCLPEQFEGNARHLDIRFLAVAPADARHSISDESLDLRWWPVDALPSDEPSLVDLVRAGLQAVARG